MKSKKLFLAGLVSIVAGVALSLQPYNSERFRTVHEFTVQCPLP